MRRSSLYHLSAAFLVTSCAAGERTSISPANVVSYTASETSGARSAVRFEGTGTFECAIIDLMDEARFDPWPAHAPPADPRFLTVCQAEGGATVRVYDRKTDAWTTIGAANVVILKPSGYLVGVSGDFESLLTCEREATLAAARKDDGKGVGDPTARTLCLVSKIAGGGS